MTSTSASFTRASGRYYASKFSLRIRSVKGAKQKDERNAPQKYTMSHPWRVA